MQTLPDTESAPPSQAPPVQRPVAAQPARWSAGRLLLTLALSVAAWALLAAISLTIGSTSVGISWPSWAQFGFRIGPVLLASLVGAGLASAGCVYQAVLRNPLADPYLLGASSGAMLATFLWALPLAGASAWLGSISQQAFAWVGAAAAVAIVLAAAQRRGRLEPVTLLLTGVIVNAINGSIFLLLFSLNLRNDMTGPTGGPFRFLVGDMQPYLTPAQVIAAGVSIGVCWLLLLCVSGELNVAALSEAEAHALGVRIYRLRWAGIILASVITASAVSISGPIGFVGLVCPHLARRFVGPDQRKLLPISTALGAGLLALADAISRSLIPGDLLGSHLPVGVLTGLLGGPFFLVLLVTQSRRA